MLSVTHGLLFVKSYHLINNQYNEVITRLVWISCKINKKLINYINVRPYLEQKLFNNILFGMRFFLL